jgi:UDP-glucose 4-epimerase
VTGGAGFIGSHVADALLAAGDEVTVVDHLDPGHVGNLRNAFVDGVGLVRGDVTDLDAMTRAVTETRPDVVYHLAAHIDVRRSMRDPARDAHTNVGGTACVLQATQRAGVRRVVLASTAGVYGDPAVLPTPEGSALVPRSPYGAGKVAAEQYLELFSRIHGLSTVSLRMANVYGPRQDAGGEAGIVAILCGARSAGTEATVFGDGAQTRDYVYVTDVAAAFVAAGRADVRGAVNVATGRETSLLDLVSAIGVGVRHGPATAGEVRRSCLDPARAARELGWRAQVSLADGLRQTLAALPAGATGPPSRTIP